MPRLVIALTITAGCQTAGKISNEGQVRVVMARGQVIAPTRCSYTGTLWAEVGRVSRSTSEAAYGSEAELLDEIRELARNTRADLVVIDPEKTKQETGFGMLHGGSIRVVGRALYCGDRALVESAFADQPTVREFQGAFDGAWICQRSGSDETFGCRGSIEVIERTDVRVIDEKGPQDPVGCGQGHEIDASDGKFSLNFEKAVDGNREGAIERIREAAANRGWNVVVLDRDREDGHFWTATPFGDWGPMYSWYEIRLFGKAYRCPPSAVPSPSEQPE